MTKFISCVFLCFFMIFFRKNIQLQVLQNLLKNFKWDSSFLCGSYWLLPQGQSCLIDIASVG